MTEKFRLNAEKNRVLQRLMDVIEVLTYVQRTKLGELE